MPLRIGFTGTQLGMTHAQEKTLKNLLLKFLPKETHHGDCTGADAQFHDIVTKCGCRTIIHPPINESKRAFCKGTIILPPKEYLDRNHDIVDETHMLIATPKSETMEIRSGTWATIRYAQKQNKAVVIIYPNGHSQSSGQN
jgi:hypothetical protein